jgi:hypothetical protein
MFQIDLDEVRKAAGYSANKALRRALRYAPATNTKTSQ